jgi:hypothetical protein
MRLRKFVLMTVVLVFILTSPALSQDWVDIKDPQELRALHSNKTFRWLSVLPHPHLEHFRADGKGILIYTADQRQIPCTWEVKDNDQVCVSTEGGTKCFRFQHSKKNPDEYVKRSTDVESIMMLFKVEDGIPQF